MAHPFLLSIAQYFSEETEPARRGLPKTELGLTEFRDCGYFARGAK